ncbi:hypothetical protein BC943DRAFT_333828 [Umbelopsis sp. AD052]|nr:hypothetical protein BC943DRAFT_333828 [Umbelopsis sp. AD052]
MRGLSFSLLATALGFGNVLGSVISQCAKVTNSSVELYTYALPIVLTKATSNAGTQNGLSGALTQDPTSHYIVKPNLDTSYIQGFFDLEKHSYTLTVPSHGDRYWIIQHLDAYSNTFADPGSRTLKDKPYTFGLVGPKGEKSHLPKNATIFQAPTNLVWVFGRIYQNGTSADQEIVRNLMKQWIVTKYPLHSSRPISVSGSPPIYNTSKPLNGMAVAPLASVTGLTTQEFFSAASQLMCNNIPPHADKTFLQRMSKDLGFEPCSKNAFRNPDLVYSCLLPNLSTTAIDSITDYATVSFKQMMHNGWPVRLSDIGAYGIDYSFRAVIALIGLGANLAVDAVYPSAQQTGSGAPLNSSQTYSLTFEKGKLPPVDAFWSITFYNSENYLQPNPVNRFALRSADTFLYNNDGSLTLYFQENNPSNSSLVNNWLYTKSNGTYVLTLRLYNPQQAISNGSWVPPPIEQTSQAI